MLSVGGLFDGCGLLAYGLHLAGLRHEWLCEVDPWRRELLARRWPGVRIYDDVRAVGADAVRVDVIAGGFPCKGASTAGKRTGFDHPETVLWREMRRAVGELQPRYVLIENVANLLTMARSPGEPAGSAWGEVLADLAALGFNVGWDCFPAAAFGAPHLRDRLIAIATQSAGTDAGRGGDQRCQADGRADAPRSQPPASERDRAVADANGAGRLERGGQVAGGTQHAAVERDGATAADASWDAEGGPSEATGAERQQAGARAGVPVEWGAYEPAIRRWEQVHGPAPQPLVRRVDDRRTNRVDRSRLSALGGGVQVQLGRLAGEHIIELEMRIYPAAGPA